MILDMNLLQEILKVGHIQYVLFQHHMIKIKSGTFLHIYEFGLSYNRYSFFTPQHTSEINNTRPKNVLLKKNWASDRNRACFPFCLIQSVPLPVTPRELYRVKHRVKGHAFNRLRHEGRSQLSKLVSGLLCTPFLFWTLKS